MVSPASRLVLGLAAVLLAPLFARAAETPRPKAPVNADETAQVLVITGSDPYLPAFVAIDAAMREAVARRTGRRVQWMYESIDALRFGSNLGPQFAEVLARKYQGIRIDAVVIVTEPAATFYLQHGRTLWPSAPVIINSVSPNFARGLPADAGVVALPVEIDYAGTLRTAFALQPKARRVLVIVGSSAFDQQQLAIARPALAQFAGRADVEFLIGHDLRAVRDRLSGESLESIALYLTSFMDAGGRVYVPRDFLQQIAEVARTPLYGAIDTFMGSGVAAGSIEPFRMRGDLTGQLLLRALAGERRVAPAVLPAPASSCVADARQLSRFGLNRRALPDGCDIRYLEPSFLQRYWWQTLLVALALGAQSALIAALLLQRGRRRAAELGLAAQRVQLLHASRLAVAGELTASIAHEINQPLGAILSNADAAEMLVQSGRLERDELLQILADIKRDDLRASEVIKRLRALLARHDVERQRIDVHRVIGDSATILGAEARRRAVIVETALDARSSRVIADPIQLQQIVINLVINAFDASADRPAGERRVRVSTADAPDGVQIRVRDFGHGIARKDLPRLFDSFFTTKASGMGLGLSIARSIVEAHGGTITASNCGVGAEFCVTLPVASDPADASTDEPETS
ncbi:MAG TPA: ATP-binding protein [Burkholderiaceae bacterium]|nr:ATP-binding protein [Burkholderiaceae bacterium]